MRKIFEIEHAEYCDFNFLTACRHNNRETRETDGFLSKVDIVCFTPVGFDV